MFIKQSSELETILGILLRPPTQREEIRHGYVETLANPSRGRPSTAVHCKVVTDVIPVRVARIRASEP